MWLLAVEALGAFCLFAFIVWWTMFSGKKPSSKKTKKTSETDKNQGKPKQPRV